MKKTGPAPCPYDKVVANEQEVPGLIPGSDVEFFSSEELFHGICELDVSVFQFICPNFVLCHLRRRLLHSACKRRLTNCVGIPVCNFLNYKTLACRSLETMEVKPGEEEVLKTMIIRSFCWPGDT